MSLTITPEQTSPKIDTQGIKRAKNAYKASIVTAVLFGLLIVTTVVVNIINRTSITDYVSLSLIGVGLVASVASARVSRIGKSDVGILLIIFTLILIVAGRVFVQKGLAVPT